MSTTDRIVEEAERLLDSAAHRLTTPDDGECLACYLVRALDVLGCDGGLRQVRRWQRAQSASTRGLTARVRAEGAFCDCEVLTEVLGVGPDDDCGGGFR